MALTSRIHVKGSDFEGPEDFLATSLGIIFPDDVTNQHGDAEHSLLYASPHLPKPIQLDLADPEGDSDRRLFSHFLWNASLLLAELVERDTYLKEQGGEGPIEGNSVPRRFNIQGLHIAELGAGTALPSIMAGLLGARSIFVTDYPAPVVMKTLEDNISRNLVPELSPHNTVPSSVRVVGHKWGSFPEGDQILSQKQVFDRVFVCDCLWMPWQHGNLRRSIGHLLKKTAEARCWVIGGFHTGRRKMSGFFDERALRLEAGCEVEKIWERDCNGEERAWVKDKEEEDPTIRKRWLVVAILKRVEEES